MIFRIKHFIRDCLILLCYIAGPAHVYRWWVRRSEGVLVRVITFHDVPNREWFESVLTLLRTECTVICPGAFEAGVFDESKINVLLTFDDGYQSWVDIVLPVLEKYGCRGIFFVNSGLVDLGGNAEEVSRFMKNNLRIRTRKAISWDGVAKLHASGQAIGGHTASHCDLSKLSEKGCTDEVRNDKERIESQIGIELKHFAYPFGRNEHMGDSVSKIVESAGYRDAFSAETGWYRKGANPYTLPRTLVEEGQGIRSIKYWIYGAYDIFNMFK